MIAAVVSTFVKQVPNLSTCLSLLRKGVDHIIVCYNVQDGKIRKDPRLQDDIVQLADRVIYTHQPGQYPAEAECTKLGLKAALDGGYEHVLKINGDVFFCKPENIPFLIGYLNDCDFISPQWHNHYRFGSTMMFFGKTDKLYEAYSTIPLIERSQLERRWQRAFKQAGLKWKLEPYAEERDDLEDPAKNGMWGELLGFFHTHGSVDGTEDLLLHKRNNKAA